MSERPNHPVLHLKAWLLDSQRLELTDCLRASQTSFHAEELKALILNKNFSQ